MIDEEKEEARERKSDSSYTHPAGKAIATLGVTISDKASIRALV